MKTKLKYDDCRYDLTEIPEGIVQRTDENAKDRSILKWSGDFEIPKIGDHVFVTMNDLGPGAIIGYSYEFGFFGCVVELTNPPDWYLEQAKRFPKQTIPGAIIYGNEMILGPLPPSEQ